MTNSSETDSDSIPDIYAHKVRTLRTRSCSLSIPESENEAEILHTLLGIELKVGKSRFACPDLPTARYMRVFARIGCRDFAIPYDITKISTLADELETAWQRSLLLLEMGSNTRTDRQKKRDRAVMIESLRNQVNASGPGDKMPEFKQSTKQRST